LARVEETADGCDIGNQSSAAEAFGAVTDGFDSHLDVLAHAAGMERSAADEDITDGEWDTGFDVNVRGTVYTTQSAFRLMQIHGGSIMNFTSGAALKPYTRSATIRRRRPRSPQGTRTVAHEWGATASGSTPSRQPRGPRCTRHISRN
jgi:NAD(P)-dependent dehydrogenase (short-subunit alcohol dehydrogenase family)